MHNDKPLIEFNTHRHIDSNTSEEARKIAIALEYDGNRAPFITATGEDTLADDIIALAKEHEIPLMENSELAGLLAKLEMGDEIPELLYLTIAQIIAFVYMLKDKTPFSSQQNNEDSSC